MSAATIRRVTGGYIVTGRWPLAGSPLSGGEMVCTSFDEAVTALYQHLHEEGLPMGQVLITQRVEEPNADSNG